MRGGESIILQQRLADNFWS